MNAVRSPRRGCSFQPRIEALEDRTVPAAPTLVDGVLTVTGDSNDNIFSILQDDSTNNLRVTMKMTPYGIPWNYDFDSSDVKTVNVDAKGGNDTVTWRLASGTNLSHGKVGNITLGGGDDIADLDFMTGVNALYDPVVLNVRGNEGNDDLVVKYARNFFDAGISLYASMGTGFDDVYVRKGGYIGTNVVFDIYGGTDADDIDVDCTTDYHNPGNDIDVHESALLRITAEGQDGFLDTVNIDYDGTVSGLLIINSYGGDGSDILETNIDLNGNSTGEVEARVVGDRSPSAEFGNDFVTLRVWNDSGASLLAYIQGGDGNDDATATPNNVEVYQCES